MSFENPGCFNHHEGPYSSVLCFAYMMLEDWPVGNFAKRHSGTTDSISGFAALFGYEKINIRSRRIIGNVSNHEGPCTDDCMYAHV